VALPKEKVRELFETAMPAFFEPGEWVATAAFVIPGPSPMAIGFVGAAIQAARGKGDLWMAVTDRRVIFVRSAFMTQKPNGFAWADARHAVQIGEVHAEERSGWNWFAYRRPDGEVLRLNFGITWDEEFTAMVEALSSPPSAPELADWPHEG